MDKKVKKLLLQYNDIIKKLRKKSVLRSNKLVSDVGEHIVCRKMGLTLAKSKVNKGYDATDKIGKKYEIKSRWNTDWNDVTLFSVSKKQREKTDYIVYIEFTFDWGINKLFKIPTEKLKTDKCGQVHLKNNHWIEEYRI